MLAQDFLPFLGKPDDAIRDLINRVWAGGGAASFFAWTLYPSKRGFFRLNDPCKRSLAIFYILYFMKGATTGWPGYFTALMTTQVFFEHKPT